MSSSETHVESVSSAWGERTCWGYEKGKKVNISISTCFILPKMQISTKSSLWQNRFQIDVLPDPHVVQLQLCIQNQQEIVSEMKGARVEKVKKWTQEIIAMKYFCRAELIMPWTEVENVFCLEDWVMQTLFHSISQWKGDHYSIEHRT